MEQASFLSDYGTFYYVVSNHTDNQHAEITITGYEGNHSFVVMPDEIDSMRVTKIGSKAFFSQKTISQLTLSRHIDTIEDWAFSHMSQLENVSFPTNAISFGKQIFLDCHKLNAFSLINESCKKDSEKINSQDLPLSLYGPRIFLDMSAPHLFTPDTIGSLDWYTNFDQALLRYLNRPDGEDFEPVILGWFNDEDYMETQYPEHIKKTQNTKAMLVLLRLIYDTYLSDEIRNAFTQYVKTHFDQGIFTSICENPNLNDLSFFKLILNLSCIDEKNIEACREKLVANKKSEAIVLLLDYQKKFLKKDDFFDTFNL